ncbi:MAG: hypothetical protein EHM33_13375 [Chloroflexi bacterium]|nr:MAG: hypothetical protein EHM33_13375 [Chloroflexota bacterium]
MSSEPAFRISYLRVRFSLIAVGLGLFLFAVGAKPNWFGWNRASVVGFVQIVTLLIGLALICLGGYVGLSALWGKEQRSIVADIGLRLIATGYVIAVFAGMADVFGMGAQTLPDNPYFGPLQATGLLIGQFVIAIGFLMLIPYHLHFDKTSK